MVDFLGLFITFVVGFLVCFVNFLLSKTILIKKPKLFSASTFLRQILNVGYLVACYFIANLLPFDRAYLLIGGALGVTLPMIYFTSKLLKIQEQIKNKSD